MNRVFTTALAVASVLCVGVAIAHAASNETDALEPYFGA